MITDIQKPEIWVDIVSDIQVFQTFFAFILKQGPVRGYDLTELARNVIYFTIVTDIATREEDFN